MGRATGVDGVARTAPALFRGSADPMRDDVVVPFGNDAALVNAPPDGAGFQRR
jgi:hypothetical protein